MPDEFIQLDRTFRALSVAPESDGIDVLQRSGTGRSLGWSDLFQLRRVVILSEAGSGKTRELKAKARELHDQGKPAFFLRLEHLVAELDLAFDVGTPGAFQTWREGTGEAWLFLDSVDESKLRGHQDFETAIRRLSVGLQSFGALQRAFIVVSGRATAWLPKSDLQLCNDRLRFIGTTRKDESDAVPAAGCDDVHSASVAESQGDAGFVVVELMALDQRQIERFARAKGIDEAQSFLDAIERADAASFAERPHDLAELIAFWQSRGEIGSRLDLIRNSVSRRLNESKPTHEEARPISPQQLRDGARHVAAACTLTRRQDVSASSEAASPDALPIERILPGGWDVHSRTALLLRPLFDQAIYGLIRFHHREVREYLTAEWFAELLKQAGVRRKIEGLFFREQYGVEVAVPSLRPVLAWLVALDHRISERAERVAPEVFFEGGDPSRLPLDMRRRILRRVCRDLAAGTANRSVQDHAAVQRFAKGDLADEVVQLIHAHRADDEVLWLLLRMVWLGRMRGARSQALSIAMASSVEGYVRRAAFQAISAVGNADDLLAIRSTFLNEDEPLDRDSLAELLSLAEPTLRVIDWLFSCVDKTEAPEQYGYDKLSVELARFAERLDLRELVHFVELARQRLERAPVIERRHCEISENFAWLLEAAGAAARRLIASRDSAALSDICLEILRKLPVARSYSKIGFEEAKLGLQELVAAWPELKYALFWHEAAEERRQLDHQKGERLRHWVGVGHYGSYACQFGTDDFDPMVGFVSSRELDDDKEVALTLAFRLYTDHGRPADWLRKLKGAVAGNAMLRDSLAGLLKPPPVSADVRRDRQSVSQYERRRREQELAQQENLRQWKGWMAADLEQLRSPRLANVEDISNWQWGLHERMRRAKGGSSQWTEGNWEDLIPEFGKGIAEAFRDGAMSYWRRYEPTLLSEGAEANSVNGRTIFGLTGLAIEAREVPGWPTQLSEADAAVAFRYAMRELNGFPHWMPRLCAAFPNLVARMALAEIDYELSLDAPDGSLNYLLADVSWSGEWLWDALAPSLLERLFLREIENLQNLEYLLNIITGSRAISDLELASLALGKCARLTDPNHLAIWFSVWVGLSPETAIPALTAHLASINGAEPQTNFAMKFFTRLVGGRQSRRVVRRDAILTSHHLKELYVLAERHIRSDEDIDRVGGGVYSPTLRDDAQDARNSLLQRLKDIPGKESYLAIRSLANESVDSRPQPWLLRYAARRAELDADGNPWNVEQVVEFAEKAERTPANSRDLFELAVAHLEELKSDLEDGDSSFAGTLRLETREVEVRKFFSGWLRDHAAGRYSVVPEEELADGKKVDLRFHGVGFDAPVPCELKLADQDHWSGPKLLERLENQLCQDYLRDARSRRGLFLLVYRGDKTYWELPDTVERIDFSGLVQALQSRWTAISDRFPGIDEIRVIGIDLTQRAKAWRD